MANSRRKGAEFENTVARALRAELGISFKRNLDQTRERNLGDLTPSDAGFPFLIECKAYASGTDCKPAWEDQARRAADQARLHACVVYKFNNHPIKCRVSFEAMAEAFGGWCVTHRTADVPIEGLAYIAREIMARRSEKESGS